MVKRNALDPILKVYKKEGKWLKQTSASHPSLHLNSEFCQNDHKEFGFNTAPTNLSSVSIRAVADSGCQSTVVPPSHIYQLGLKKRDLIPVVSKMRAA